MLGHRDGGRLVAGTYTSTDRTLRVAEVIVGGLLSAEYSDEDAARMCWAHDSFDARFDYGIARLLRLV